ncbi:zinc finger BED domain-containing 1-like [Brachionus plicatilis]|uniref:Zinc finger BED domain-containing 1-like n=1 Tax=Brachionus plicatilis TaxID=10195 RepID=A0A3M7PV56_BRAPC|nr:zinc finger BED domain-containing 1-like [Brachionus plicatilis]
MIAGDQVRIIRHYLENSAFRSFALGFKCMTERNRAEDIKEIVFEILSEYGITEKVFGIVTDNNSTKNSENVLMFTQDVSTAFYLFDAKPTVRDSFSNFFLKCLGPFNKLSETMSGKTYVTTSLIIPGLKFIETKLVAKEDDNRLSKDLKAALKQSYDHCNIIESNDFLIASTFLHPFYNEFEFAKNFLIDLFKSKRFNELIASSRKEGIIKSHSLKKKLNFEDSENSSDEDEESIDIKKEHSEYMKDRSNIDVLDYWRFNKFQFPILSSLASVVLAIPATSVRDYSHMQPINFETEEIEFI